MEKSPVVIALLTMMMVKSVNAQIGALSQDRNRTQPGTSSYDREKSFGEANSVAAPGNHTNPGNEQRS